MYRDVGVLGPGGRGSGDEESGGSSNGDDGTDAIEGPPVEDHPAAVGLADQPRLGDFDRHVIVAFEDTSCPGCAVFERETIPKFREDDDFGRRVNEPTIRELPLKLQGRIPSRYRTGCTAHGREGYDSGRGPLPWIRIRRRSDTYYAAEGCYCKPAFEKAR